MTPDTRHHSENAPHAAEPDHATRPAFTVIIVNYNGGDYLAGAIQSLARQSFRAFEVILVDNASSDGSLDTIDPSGLPAFTLLREHENHGFAKANNLAASRARGSWLALLNPDCRAETDWLEQVANGIARHPATASFACLQLDLADPNRLDGMGDSYLAFGFPWRNGYRHAASHLRQEGPCFSACGASTIIRRDVFLAYGGFDPRLFCYCEDVDLGFRLQLAGETCLFLPKAVVRHAGSGTTPGEVSQYYGFRNRIWVYAKNMPGPLVPLTLPGHVALSAVLLVRAALDGRFRRAWTAMRDGIAGIGRIRAPSPQSPPARRISLVRLARRMHWNPLHLWRHGRTARTARPQPLAQEPGDAQKAR